MQRQAGAHGSDGGRGHRKTLGPDSDEGFPVSRRAAGRPATPRPNPDEVSDRNHRAERQRRSDVRAAKEVGVSRYAVRQAERVKEADPKLFEQVKAGRVPLREAERHAEQREEQELRATLDRIDPKGANLDEVVPLLDEVNRYGAQVGIDHLRNYCSALEGALAATGALRVVDGGGSR